VSSGVFRHRLGVRAAVEERAALERAPGNGALARLRIVLSSPDSSSPSRMQPCARKPSITVKLRVQAEITRSCSSLSSIRLYVRHHDVTMSLSSA
jgi:hypothetical protein